MGKTASHVFGLAPNVRVAFLAVVTLTVSYATALLAVVYAYRKAYGIVGRSELALHYTARKMAKISS